ncbi:MAG: phosphoribosylformylglycinamidine synthase subunit PurQ [Phycisphaerales bacterium]|nr:phosphoribosylformylglycinamidine synthase subunit PurQ [Phycisphaerales bacterium]
MPPTTRALVIRAAGINCDEEMARGFRLAGAEVDLVHVHVLAEDPDRLDGYGVIGFPGGFSYGDDVASGRVLALLVRERLYPALRRAAARGVPMLGICHGFQVLTQLGLLRGPRSAGDQIEWPETPASPTVALCDNAAGRYADRWVRMDVDAESPCVWTRGLADDPSGSFMLPVGHGEGRFVASDAVASALIEHGQAPLRYVDNFNGSTHAIAGVCDPTGRILGLMPHPDRFLDWTRHPHFTRLDRAALAREPSPGLRMFINAVEAAAPTTPTSASVTA